MAISNNSTGLRPGVCTSTTRPTAPYEGQTIFETDTNKLLVWDGTAWVIPANMPWGIVALTPVTATDTFTTEEIEITSSTFTAVASRYYRVTYFEPKLYSTTGANEITMKIRLTNISGTVQQTVVTSGSGVYGQTATVSIVKTFSAGSTVLVGTLQCSATTGSAERSATQIAYLLVEDIGPA